MQLDPYTIMLCSLWAGAAAGLAWYCAIIGQQITYVTLADGRKQERRLPLMFRALLPLAPNITPLFRQPAWTAMREKGQGRIVSAGFEGLMSGEEYLSLRLLMPLVLGIPWLLFVKVSVAAAEGTFLTKIEWLLYVFGPLWFFAYPSMWLRRALVLRHRNIQRSLPFVLDLLTLSVEAGMDFMTALQRNVQRRKIDALGEELIRVIREIQLGKTRREALRAMSLRVNLSDLRSVVNALVQADELGVSIGSILRIQAEQMRQRRFERAEKLANEAPVKLMFPLLCFIFPSVFLILLGPVLLRLVQQGF